MLYYFAYSLLHIRGCVLHVFSFRDVGDVSRKRGWECYDSSRGVGMVDSFLLGGFDGEALQFEIVHLINMIMIEKETSHSSGSKRAES